MGEGGKYEKGVSYSVLLSQLYMTMRKHPAQTAYKVKRFVLTRGPRESSPKCNSLIVLEKAIYLCRSMCLRATRFIKSRWQNSWSLGSHNLL